jgi:hypothetical protein
MGKLIVEWVGMKGRQTTMGIFIGLMMGTLTDNKIQNARGLIHFKTGKMIDY